MQPIINYAICAVSAYLIGSLSFGIIISKLFYHKDRILLIGGDSQFWL